MIDAKRAESSDKVTCEEAVKRFAQIESVTHDLSYSYKLALNMNNSFVGEAIIEFKANSNEDSIWLNTSVEAIGGVKFNDVDLCEWAKNQENGEVKLYERHRLTMPAELIRTGED